MLLPRFQVVPPSMRTLLAASLLLLALGQACTHKAPEDKAADREQLSALLLTATPKPQVPLDIRFGAAVRLLGYDLVPKAPQPGEPATITWYWQVDKPLPKGYQQFTHLSDARGQNQINLDRERVLDTLYPPQQWKAGEFLRDPLPFTAPSSFRGPSVQFFLGFYHGHARLPVSKGATDGQNRAKVVVPLTLAAPRAPTPVAQLTAPRRRGVITLDGHLNEADWQTAGKTEALVNTMRGTEGSFPAHVSVLHDSEALYIGFDVEDERLLSPFTQRDGHLWEQDTVEVMLDPDGDGNNYFEIQVSPRGVIFDTQYDSRRRPQPFGHIEWDSKITAGVQVRGRLDDEDTDEGYTVEMRIPISALVANGVAAVAPAAAGSYRMNFFVMDKVERGQRAVGWSPPLVGDFHAVHRFGIVNFGP